MLGFHSNQQQHLVEDGVIEIVPQILSNALFSLSSPLSFPVLDICAISRERGLRGNKFSSGAYLQQDLTDFTCWKPCRPEAKIAGVKKENQRSTDPCYGDSRGILSGAKKKTLKPSFKEKRLQPHLSEKPFEDKAVALTVSEKVFNLKI